LLAVFVIPGLLACGEAPTERIVGKSSQPVNQPACVVTGNLPSNFPTIVANNGDTLKTYRPAAGFAVVITNNCAAYDQYGTAVTDITMQWIDPKNKEAVGMSTPTTDVAVDDDFYFVLQWGHDAVRATEAWANGVRGAGVKVAVLDTGFDTDHPDLAPNIDPASIDLTGEGLVYGLPDPWSHGTHTAGTIAAADNAFGTIGVAPEATLLLVKVLRDSGSGSFADVLDGMVYAVDHGAQVINMSLGGYVPQSYATSMNHVVNYCFQKGAVIVASAGNDAVDLDHIKKGTTIPDYFGPGLDMVFPDASWEHVPSGLYNVISISATAPIGWATDPGNINLDYPAHYTNYGKSGVTFGAPGGDYVYPGNEFCVVGPVFHYCWVFDLVFSTGNNGWYWGAGTSMAAPHASGVAALIISENGGSMKPAQVMTEILKRADDLGKPGKDDYYGLGRVASGY
jgi:subtilisin family serine protease